MAAALTNALRRIRSTVSSSGQEPIPNDRWTYRDWGSGVAIRVASQYGDGGFVSWQILSWVLGGLLVYVTADGGANAKEWGFEIHFDGVGVVGNGAVVQDPRMSGGSVE